MHCKEEQNSSKENLQHLNFDISYHSENMHKYATPDFIKKYQPRGHSLTTCLFGMSHIPIFLTKISLI